MKYPNRIIKEGKSDKAIVQNGYEARYTLHMSITHAKLPCLCNIVAFLQVHPILSINT